MRKLGVSSRTELAGAASDSGRDPVYKGGRSS
jgi:hypothetical protein